MSACPSAGHTWILANGGHGAGDGGVGVRGQRVGRGWVRW